MHQLVPEPSNFLSMARRKRNRGNRYASFGVVHERKETTHDERLVVHLQRMDEQFVARSRLMEHIKALSD
jgi:hypothetical protein